MYITNNNRMNPAAAADGIIPATGAPPTAAEMAIVGFIIVVTLYFGQVVFVPLALAVILSFVLAPGIRLLKRAGLPNAPSVILVVFVAFSIIFGVGALITQQVGTLAKELPRYQITLKEKIVALREATAGSGGAFQQASDTLKDLQKQLETPSAGAGARRPSPSPSRRCPGRSAAMPPSSGKPIPVEVHTPAPTPLDQLQTIIGIVLEPLATFGAVLLFVLFLLLQREDVRDRAIRLMGSHDLEKSTTAMDDAGDRLSKYFLGMTAINAGFGVIIGVGLWMIGVPEPRAVGRARHADALRAVHRLVHRRRLSADAGGGRRSGLEHVPVDARPLRDLRADHGQRHRAAGAEPPHRPVAARHCPRGRVLDAAVGADRPAARHSADGGARRPRPPCRASRVSERGARRHAAAVAARALLSAHAGG